MLSKIIVSLMVILIAAKSYAFDETRIYRDYQDVISKTAGMVAGILAQAPGKYGQRTTTVIALRDY